MKNRGIILLTMFLIATSASACGLKQTDNETLIAVESSEDAGSTKPEDMSLMFDDDRVREILASVAETWRLDVEKTEEHLQSYDSLQAMFGTGLGAYGASMEIGEDGSFRYSIGIGIGGTVDFMNVEGDTRVIETILLPKNAKTQV